MTPPPAAATAAGRRVTAEASTAYVPRAPRRVSGPVREPETRPRPVRREPAAPARKRREPPARRPAAQRRGRAQQAPRLALRLQPPRLDRIVRGRAWIPVLGATLVAIVGLRVEVLKLGSGVGSEVQQATALQSSNSALRAQISALSDNRRIAKLAAAYGMRMPDPLDVHFVQASIGTHVGAAIHNISAPSSSSFLSGLASEQQTSQQSTQAIAAQNGAATSTANSTAPGSTVGAALTAGSTATSTGSDVPSSSTNTAGTTGGATSTGGSASTIGEDTGATSGAGTTGVSSDSSQTTSPSDSTNGGSGLAG